MEVNSLCKNKFLTFLGKCPMFSLSGKMNIQTPYYPCAMATLKNYHADIFFAVFLSGNCSVLKKWSVVSNQDMMFLRTIDFTLQRHRKVHLQWNRSKNSTPTYSGRSRRIFFPHFHRPHSLYIFSRSCNVSIVFHFLGSIPMGLFSLRLPSVDTKCLE